MKMLYIANIRLPTEKAHGIQVMKACEAFANENEIELIVPNRISPIKEDPFSYYGVKKLFPINRLFTIDTIGWGAIGYIFQSVLFGFTACIHIWIQRMDVIYGRDEIVLTVIGLLTGKKIIWESHDGAWNVWARYVVRRASGIVVVTDGAVEFYTERGVASKKLFAISNGIDLGDFASPETKHDARNRLGLSQDDKIALYIGRLDGWKGVDTLLKASKLLSDIRVAIIGGEEKQIETLSKEYPNVIFLGYRPYIELSNNQVAGDVLVVPNTGKNEISVRFTSPLKLISAMASGVPTIVSDLPSTRWIAGDTSLFVPPDNPKALAGGIETLISEPSRAHELAERAVARSVQFSWKNRAHSILTYMAGILGT
jgi:glycosyltransferase involved in cell wall biosynthesis